MHTGLAPTPLTFASVYDASPVAAPQPRERDEVAAAAAAIASAATPPVPRRTTATQTDTSAADAHAGRDGRPRADALDLRRVVFAVHDGKILAVVTDEEGKVVRTVPPEELEEVRRAQSRAGLLVDVHA